MAGEVKQITNSQVCGMCDVHIAKVTADTSVDYTAVVPEKFAVAVNGKYKLNYEQDVSYGDDVQQKILVNYKDGELELELFNLNPKDIAVIYGHKYVKGMNTINAGDVGDDVAISFRAKMDSGKYQFYQFYRVNFSGDEEGSFETIADKTKRQPVKIKGNILSRMKDGNIGVFIYEDYLATGDTEAKALLAVDSTSKKIKWFTAVQEPIPAGTPSP